MDKILVAIKVILLINYNRKYTDSTCSVNDVNVCAVKGYKVVNLTIGMTNTHSVKEFIKIEYLYKSSIVIFGGI